jgi:tetratricopeptide (TPR) repeat protein
MAKFLKVAFVIVVSVSSGFGGFSESLWKRAYEAELRCDVIESRNALMRLKEYDRFGLIRLSRDQRLRIGELINSKRVERPEIVAFVETTLPIAPARNKRKKPAARPRLVEPASAPLDLKRIEADYLRKAENAYQFGRLEEANRLYRKALKLNPASAEAAEGIAKVTAEMQ